MVRALEVVGMGLEDLRVERVCHAPATPGQRKASSRRFQRIFDSYMYVSHVNSDIAEGEASVAAAAVVVVEVVVVVVVEVVVEVVVVVVGCGGSSSSSNLPGRPTGLKAEDMRS